MAKSSRKKGARKTAGASSRKTTKKTKARPKKASKKVTKKRVTKKTTRKTTRKKTPVRKAKTTKAAAKKVAKRAPAAKPAAKPPAKAKPAGAPASKSGPAASQKKDSKGITVVSRKSRRESSSVQMPATEPLLRPGGKWKPLIPSGPSAAAEDGAGAPGDSKKKQRLTKRELTKYRKILLQKREELLGDIVNMEDEALRGSGSGSLSHTPQHMAEQGSDAYDQSLSLDLAQVDRNLLKEIDEALARIDAGTYGICELTGKRIRSERLEELPWTRFSIEAARQQERRSYR